MYYIYTIYYIYTYWNLKQGERDWETQRHREGQEDIAEQFGS